MHVIFVEPRFPFNQREFVRGLHAAGARVTGVGERPWDSFDEELKSWMVGYEQVQTVVHEGTMLDAVQRIQSRGWVDRLEATVEAHILPAAKVREAAGIPGTSVRTAFLCRDKPAMKEALREADVPCAQSRGVSSPQELRMFAAEVGYPIIIKPRAAAGAAGTQRVSNDRELERPSSSRARPRRPHRGRGVHRRPRKGSTIPSDRRRSSDEFGHPPFTRTSSRRWHALIRPDRHHQPRGCPGLRRSATSQTGSRARSASAPRRPM
ncbi:MAG: hypothetical protein R2862_12090 [Thermoanaerobaculia bacterium]